MYMYYDVVSNFKEANSMSTVKSQYDDNIWHLIVLKVIEYFGKYNIKFINYN